MKNKGRYTRITAGEVFAYAFFLSPIVLLVVLWVISIWGGEG